MYFNPLTQFVRSLVTGKRRIARRIRRPLSNRERRRIGIGSWLAMAAPAELLEERSMLSGPSLVTIAPNTGGFLANGQVTTEAPKELTFTFSPGSSIDPNTLAAGISITRSGVDNAFGDANDQTITPGFMGVAVAGNGSNQVTLRFADTLPDDLYRISITGALKNTANESFNNGITQTLDFRVDYGAQVISLVPQPVLRTENLNVLNFSKISDLDKFTITAGGVPVTFQFKNTATGSVVGAGNTAILYSAADNATTLATKINAAINTKFGVGGAVSSIRTGTTLALAGDAFTPNVKITTAQTGALSLTDGGLVQKRDTIVAYFNQDALNPTLAQDPGYYRVINTATGSILLPSSIKYDSASNTAVLKFGADLPDGTFHLTIGAPNPAQNTLSTAAGVGTLFGDTGGFSTTAFLGNANHLSSDPNDVDLYKFQTGNGTNITIDATQLASGLGSVVYLRLFDANGVELAHSDPTSAVLPNRLVFSGSANTFYYVGVSSVSTSGTGNTSYNPSTGAGAAGGIGAGSYKLSIQLDGSLSLNNDTTSFATSTSLGVLGSAGHIITDVVAPLGNLAYPTLPGGPDQPGARQINVVGENNSGVPLSTSTPGSIATRYYNFKDVYGVDPQNNILHNAITDEQKNLARQIFQIYGSYLGVEFVETDNQGLTVVTGDVRAVDPTITPDAVGGIFGGSNAIVNASAVPGGSSQYGGTWFAIAFHEIGHSLGLEHSYDAPSVMGPGVGAGTGVEPVYPGDINLVPALSKLPPNSTDINLYQFNVDQTGVFSAEVIAQRLTGSGNTAPSLLDSVVTLYKETGGVRTIVARNDDYFGRDSFVSLHLDVGTYYLAVSSTGNTSFDPSVSDTGFGGRTDGNYQLKLSFAADPIVGTTLNDVGGVAFDGDANAVTGGTFNFWFNSNTAANTIFVDKANTAGGQTGSIASPYSTISAALAVATPGKIVRILGNGGTDGSSATLGDNKAYTIGFDSLGNAAADGSEFKVPQGVTVMIDAGAVIKLRSAIIDVGDSVPNIDRSGSALQVLGTPDNNVVFTSLRNNAIGGNSDPTNFLPASGGNWGGLVFRQASDVQGRDYQNNGIFLNSVNQANITYGGGQVFDDSVLQVFNPIHLSNPDQHASFFARPAIWNNTLTLNADAAISADPNSFYNSVDRVGPDIHGNKVVNNTINGLFIRVTTPLGQGLEKLEVPARFDETDITYVLTENLLIDGNPGGPYQPNPGDASHTGWDARVAGSLIIDPGVIFKLNGAHIEAQVGGSQLIAEGDVAHPIIFTSLKDDTYGAGGTFDTGNDGKTAGAAGNWGGLFFNSSSAGSIDHAVIQYGGGYLFNAVEIQQAHVRITNTYFQNNGDGDSGGDNRNGLLTNGPATIFVRGAQPVIAQNTFVNNAGNVLSVNVNALNSLSIADWGRSSGVVDAFTQFANNHGPLVRLNRYLGNGTNGMEVRGEIITTESTWDDTDIVHVVRTQIADTVNLHTYGGIRLQSDADSSLVVKLLGANAGFLINGTPLDINDRIGGTLQVVGTPSHPVILTSLNNDKVGAGFRPDGQPLLDTNSNGSATLPQPGDWNSIAFLQYTNDTNVAVYVEVEQIADQQDTNGTPATAEFLGNLAPDTVSDNPENAKAGNDDQPLGFEVHGFLNKPTDVDVYSFNAAAGTEVWFDIGRSSSALDSVLELIDANGNVLASSNDSQLLTRPAGVPAGLELPLQKDAYLGGDFYTTNPRDAGFRAILPGTGGVSGTYFIRVRSTGGLTMGAYQLQVRSQQVYEHPGSTVRYASVSYATNGIELHGMPGHSPLSGTSTEIGGNNSFGSAQGLGNLLASDQNMISVGGSLASSSQVDWYKFNLDFDLIQAIGGVSSSVKTWATIFDIDYADGLARPNATISVFDASGRLILISRNSDVTNDQPAAGQGNDLDDLTRGSVGKLDPYIGSVMMPTGFAGSSGGIEDGGGTPGVSRTYYVAISANFQLPQALDATFAAGSGNQQVRIEPVDSVRRIAEDHIGLPNGYRTGSDYLLQTSQITPDAGLLLPIDSGSLSTTVRTFTLGDAPFYVNSFGRLVQVNASTGATLFVPQLSIVPPGTAGAPSVSALQYRSDGTLYAYQGVSGATGAGFAGQLATINPITGVESPGGTDGIPDRPNPPPNPPVPAQVTTNTVDSFTWIRTGDNGDLNLPVPKYEVIYYAVRDPGTGTSRLYQGDASGSTAGVANGGFKGFIDSPQSLANLVTPSSGGLDAPSGITIGPDGRLYVVSSATNSVLRYNATTGAFIDVFASGNGLSNPTDAVFGPDGNLYVSSSNGKILRFNGANGAFIDVFASGNGLTSPSAMVFGPDGNLYIAETGSIQGVLRFNGTTGAFDSIFVADGAGGLSNPQGLTFGTDGNLYVSSFNTDQVLRYTNTGAFDKVFVAANSGGLDGPSGVGFGPDGRFYVAGTNSQNVLIYSGTTGASAGALVSAAAGLNSPQDLLWRGDGTFVVSDTGNDKVSFVGTIGHTTGMAEVNGTLYGVSDKGFFYSINSSNGLPSIIANFSGTFNDFEGLTVGPQNAGNGIYKDMLFAMAADGTLVALDTAGTLQNVFSGGASSIQTGMAGSRGITFSPFDFNLWHPTTKQATAAGHGIPLDSNVFDESRDTGGPMSINGRHTTQAEGGASFYYGLENWVRGDAVNLPLAENYLTYGANAQYGILTQSAMTDLLSNPALGLGNNYNVPSGTAGSLITNSFSLAGYSSTDLPTLYFNYLLGTEGASGNELTPKMLDSARAFISTDGGNSWSLLATNNSDRSNTALLAELPQFVTAQANDAVLSSGSYSRAAGMGQQVQELFDTNTWRQARVDLSPFVGSGNVKLRFDFSTYGQSFTNGQFGTMPGDFAATPLGLLQGKQGQNNSQIGFFVDDITVGLAARGEMVTTAPAGGSGYFQADSFPESLQQYKAQQLTGPYQLEIRGGTAYTVTGSTLLPAFSAIEIDPSKLIHVNDDQLTDRNAIRRQGVINISSNTISFVSNAGIFVDSGRDDASNDNIPHPGSAINGPTLNSDQLVPGPQISNNVIYNFGQTGIAFSGDNNSNGATSGAPYGRIVNNSIYGGSTVTGKTGIQVSENAAPTIINNIVSNTATGISVDGSSASRTVIRTTLFKANTSNGVQGLDFISLGNAEPLFLNPATGNFYLAPGSKAIDSSLNTQQDRPSIVAVESALGIPQSPVTAPAYDRFGQLRIDDPATPNANGLGLNIFKDRGALERADFAGPSAELVVPLDNGPDDGNLAVGTFFMTTPVPLSEIDVALTDIGIGIDSATVSSAAFVLKQDGVTLIDGVDYVFSYNSNTGRVAFLSVSEFPSSSTYTINVDTTAIKDIAGNALQGNQPDGSLLFTIIGNAPPHLTAIATLPGLKNSPRVISFADLKAASDLSVVTGHTSQFRIETVTNGSLTITHLGVTSAVVPGTTYFVDGDTLTWTPPVNTTGITPAFTVIGYDPENAVIAPALQFSSPAVSVSIDLVNVGPVLTSITTLPGASEDTDFTITYATLKAASDLADANNDNPLYFQIMSQLSGSTLEINDNGAGYVPVVVGTTLFGPGDVLKFRAPSNQNNELNGNNPLNAFTVLGFDGEVSSSAPAVQVKIDVAPVADAPIMTTLTKFGLGGLNSQFPILYSDLVSHSDVQNVDGHAIQFRIESVTPGATLQIKHLGSVTTVVPGTTVVVAGDSLFWTPPLGVFGTAVNAFNVVAYDGANSAPFNISSPQLTANVEVINSPAPTLTTLATFTRPRFVATPLTFADLQAASNVTIAAGHTLGFRIDSLSSGTLQITRLGVTTTAVAGTVVVAGDTLTWTSLPGATGLTDAFKVLAVDVTNTLTSLDPVQVRVDLVNVAPTLSTVNTFGGAIQQTPYNITYSMLQAAANEFDANNDALGFRIRAVQNGTLKITKSGTSTAVAVVAGVTLVEAGDVLTWTGAVGSNGTVSAFSIRAWDGLVESGSDIQVSLNVAAFGSQYSLSGPWVVGGKLARINQVGSNLTYSDQNNAGSTGAYTSFNTITGRNGLTGVVDTSTPDNGRIVWSDGAIWLKLSVGGQYYVPAANNALVKVIQTGVSLTFYNRFGQTAVGTFTSPTLISIPDWKVTVSYTNGALSFSNGAYWKKLDLSPTYTESVSGQKVGVIQRFDSVELTFVDTVGGTSKGVWNSPTQVTATGWNSVGTVINGQILWSGGVRNGEIWNKNLVLVGASSVAGPGFVTITATNNQILLTNRVGTVDHVKIIDANTMVSIDTGKIIKRVNGKLEFPDALTWGNFDFNALDAVFSDIKTFPFGS